MLFNIAVFEFICAQAPYTLKGLLVGLVYSVDFSSHLLGYIIYLAWDLGWKKTVTQPSCGFWYYLFIALTATLGFVIWCIVAKWYKRRERDEPAYEHMFEMRSTVAHLLRTLHDVLFHDMWTLFSPAAECCINNKTHCNEYYY